MRTFFLLFVALVLPSPFAVAADQSQPPAAGSRAPLFRLPNQEGAQVSLDQFKGKVLLFSAVASASIWSAARGIARFDITTLLRNE